MIYINTLKQINQYSKPLCIAVILFICSFSSRAQLVVTGNRTATELTNLLAGHGITILNPTLKCFYKANGTFTVSTISPLGIDSGIILTTGSAVDSSSSGSVLDYGVANPSSDFASGDWGEAGDSDLTQLAGNEVTNDACILQFDLVPLGDSIKFNYVFGSEEYTDYACTEFNDVFGFFIKGGSYTTPTNIALVPGTSIPVCINSVNCGATGGGSLSTCSALGTGSPFCSYYINNTLTTSIAKPYVVYDGLTTLLQAKAVVSPCDTYHMKLAIADGTDDAFDSGVFIEGGSLSSGLASVGFTNPTYCGNNDGSIIIGGLKPGTHDSINYEFESVAHPQLVTVALDSTIQINHLCAGVYNDVTLTTYTSCTLPPFAPVTLVNPPYATIHTDYTNQTTCGINNGSITLYGLQPGQEVTINYTWNGTAQPPVIIFVAPDGSYTFTGLPPGIYDNFVVTTGGACEAINPNACTSNVVGPITLIPINIAPDFTDIIHYGCQGDTVFFYDRTHVPGSPHLHYDWDFGDGRPRDTTANPTHIYVNTVATYTVTLGISYLGCDSSFSLPVTLNNFLSGGFTSAPAAFVCQDSVITFANTSAGTDTGITPTYTWYFGDGITSTDISPTHTYPNSGNYKVTLVAANAVPCYDTITQMMAVDSNSMVSLHISDTIFCEGQGITFTGTYSLIGLNNIIWTFSDGGSAENKNPVLHAYDSAGSMTVTAQIDYRSCPDKTISGNILILPGPSIDLGPDTALCPGNTVIELADNNNAENSAASWQWNTGQTTSAITVNTPGNYYATVTINGCSASDSVTVANSCYIDIPNVFTPNGDGINDYFFPRQYLTRGLNTFTMYIYNRWGQLVFATGTLDGRGWDGTLNNTPQPDGVYVYVIDATFHDGQKEHRQGNVTLLR